MSKKKKMLIGVGVVVVILVVGGLIYWNAYTNSEGYLMEKMLKEQIAEYENDTFGGSTAEETLELFISALKAGDVELASKYFILDDQEEWFKDLALLESKGLLSVAIADIERAKKYRESGEEAIFTAANKQNEAIVNIRIIKISNGIWKISGL